MVFLWIYLIILLISTLTWIGFGIKYLKYFKENRKNCNHTDLDDLGCHMNAILEHIVCDGLIESQQDYDLEYHLCSNRTLGCTIGLYILGFVLWPASWVIFFIMLGLQFIKEKLEVIINNWIKR
jgi:hypothetical protein